MRMPALVVAVAGGAGAVGLTLHAGRGNHQPLLMILMTGWVAAPFVALIAAHRLSQGWLSGTRAALTGVTFVVTIATLAVYGTTVPNPPGTTRGVLFVVVPAASWLLMAIVIPVAAVIARRNPRNSS